MGEDEGIGVIKQVSTRGLRMLRYSQSKNTVTKTVSIQVKGDPNDSTILHSVVDDYRILFPDYYFGCTYFSLDSSSLVCLKFRIVNS